MSLVGINNKDTNSDIMRLFWVPTTWSALFTSYRSRPCAPLFEDYCDSLSHPSGVAFRQFGNKKDGFPRVHINGSEAVGLGYSKSPVEEGLLQNWANQPEH